MFRRGLLLIALAGIYVMGKRIAQNSALRKSDRVAEAQWANEGGGNGPPSA